jgi:TRAP-type transport system periplasmic protein
MKRALTLLVLLAAGGLVGVPAAAQRPLEIRLGTMVPGGTIWSSILKDQAAEWQRLTSGRVRLIVNAGTQGDEETIVRKMQVSNQLQAASLSIIGLSRIDTAFDVFGIPLFFDSYEELYYVLEQVEPILRKRLEDRGFVLVNWGNGGWLYVFSTKPAASVEELRSLKFFTSAGDDETVQWYLRNGFKPVALSATDMLSSLTTGLIDAVPSTPLIALSFQWYRRAPHMLDVGLNPLVGATIVTNDAWQKIPDADRAALVKAATRIEQRLHDEVPVKDREAVAVMEKHGLKVARVDARRHEEFRRTAEGFARTIKSGKVPDEILGAATRARDRFRAEHGRAGQP